MVGSQSSRSLHRVINLLLATPSSLLGGTPLAAAAVLSPRGCINNHHHFWIVILHLCCSTVMSPIADCFPGDGHKP
ncbi:uncharacterized protein DS421_16g550600 [Arachis hypogaea]|nr:uncharacterized protein DS421_16g550600 [Arachis hypogaea]